MIPQQYCTLASHKLDVARFHVAEFEKLTRQEVSALVDDDPGIRYAPFHAHADGAIVEAFAAFDTYSCAVAHKFGVPRSDRASLKGIVERQEVSAEVHERVTDALAAEEWKRLEELRNLAGHRGLVSESMR
jgi:hypothetical protein